MISKKFLLCGVMAVVLTGCATAGDKADWDCGVQTGFGCMSIARTAQRILSGNKSAVTTETFSTKSAGSGVDAFTAYTPDYGKVSSLPKWREQDIMKIHVMPFIDGVNSYHERTVIYAPVTQGGWSRD